MSKLVYNKLPVRKSAYEFDIRAFGRHGPLAFRRVDRPIFHLTVGTGKEYVEIIREIYFKKYTK